jgi:hypothetical protein
VKQRDKAFNFKTADQIFLREKIWPAIWRRTLIHDANYDLFGATKFPAGDVLPRRRHIGQNESVFFKPDA